MHWLAAATTEAGLIAADDLNLRSSVSITEAWEVVARSCGLNPDELAERIAPSLKVTAANLDATDRRALRLIPERLARRLGIYPVHDGDDEIVIATANPLDFHAQSALEFAAGRRVVFQLAAPDAIARATNAGYAPLLAVETVLGALDASSAAMVRVIEEEAPEQLTSVDVAAEPIVRLSSVILRDAILQDASDIHIEPGPNGGAVRFRIDGLMRVYLRLPAAVVPRVVSRIKVLARLDISNRLRPHDGRARISVDGRDFDLRVSTVPTSDGEKAVIRILRPLATRTLDNIGIGPNEIARFRRLLANRDGLVAITGPTGSGKTTTIYGALREIAARDVNLVTVEDPVEYRIPGITQIQASPKQGVTFASALRSILRQDPDVIFIGEIRDLETAEIAIQAAMTGHLVLATVHANDAIGAVARLHDLGVDLPGIGTTFRGALAQRLVRRLCPECAVNVTALTADEERLSEQFGVRPLRRAMGCPACATIGFRGRFPVAEVVVTNAELAALVATGGTAVAMHRAALREGMRTMLQAGLSRVKSGETTLQEIERVLGAGETIAADSVGDGGELRAPVLPPIPRRRSSATIQLPPDEPALVLSQDATFDPSELALYEAAIPSPVVATERVSRRSVQFPVPPPPLPPRPAPHLVTTEPIEHRQSASIPRERLSVALVADYGETIAPPETLPAAFVPPPRRSATIATPRLPFDGPPRTLLVADDPVNREYTRLVLESAGCDIVEADDLDAAMTVLRDGAGFRLMVADLTESGEDGLELMRIVRGYLAEELPIIVLSTPDDRDRAQELLDAGADDYLDRPIDPDRFVSRVTALIRRLEADPYNRG